MAHGNNPITTQRIVRLESLFDDHSNEGGNIPADAAFRHNGLVWAVVRDAKDHGEFHLRQAQIKSYGLRMVTSEPHGVLYRPIHASMTAEDIEGAVYPHDDGTHWLFARCSPAEQVDFAADARTFAIDQFTAALARAQVKVDEATNAPVKAVAVAKAKALIAFAEAVGRSAYTTVVSATLGHYHRDPHHDHRRDLAIAAIDAVLADWATKGATDKAIRQDRTHVAGTASVMRSVLASTHAIEWRHERAARLKAEAEAAESAPSGDAESAPSGDAESGS